MQNKLALALVAALCAVSAVAQPVSGTQTPAEDDDPSSGFLTAFHAYLEAARYDPVETDLQWVAWIGASADVVRAGATTIFFTGQVETTLGHRVRMFEATQANYSLEVGARIATNRGALTPFFHHVSRHVQDRVKIEAIDWNFLGARYERAWPASWERSGGFLLSGAVATLASGVEYKFEGRAAIDLDLRRSLSSPYFLADVRAIQADASAAFPRTGFADLRAELGYRARREERQFALFVAYENRHDVLIPRAATRKRALFGFRIRSGEAYRPAVVPLP